MKFRTMYDNTIPVLPIPNGDKYRKVFKDLEPFEVDEHGECINKSRFVKRVETGEVIDIQAQINSYLDSTRIETILRSMSGNQEKIIFDPNLPVEDLTDLPKTLGELKQAQQLYETKIAPALKNIEAQQTQVQHQSLNADEIIQLRALLSKNGGSGNE